MAKRDQEEEELSPDAQGKEEAVMETRRASAGAQAGREAEAKGVLAEALLRESVGKEGEESEEEGAPETKPLSMKEVANLQQEYVRVKAHIRLGYESPTGDRTLEEYKDELTGQIMKEVSRMTDTEMLGGVLFPDLLDEEGKEWKDLIASKIDLISREQKQLLCYFALLKVSSTSTESSRFLIEEVLPNLETDAQNAVMEKFVHHAYLGGKNEEKKAIAEKLFAALDLTPKTKGSILGELAEHDIDFVRTHIGEADNDSKETIMGALSRRGYSLVEGEPVRKVESSLLLMEEMRRGFLLSDWREKHRDLVSFDLADAATLQKALEDVAQSRFEKPLDRLHPSEMKRLLTDEVAQEIDKELLPKIEAEMEPSTFRLILQSYTKSYDRANRCMEALAKKWHRKSLDKLSTEKFRELLGRDEEIKKWINDDRLEQFTKEIDEALEGIETYMDERYALVVTRTQKAMEFQIQQAVTDFKAALDHMPAVAASVKESLVTVREQMAVRIKERYDAFLKDIEIRHQASKRSFRGRVGSNLTRAVEDEKDGGAWMVLSDGEREYRSDEFEQEEPVSFRGGTRTYDYPYLGPGSVIYPEQDLTASRFVDRVADAEGVRYLYGEEFYRMLDDTKRDVARGQF